MKISEIRNLPDDEILSEITKVEQKIFKLRFHEKGSSVENPGSLTVFKRDIARMRTVLREREVARERKKDS